jgi:hypothetical protein
MRGKSTVADDFIMSGETIATHTQTVNQSLQFSKEFTKPELVRSSSVPVDFTENAAVEENRVGKDGTGLSSSTQRLTRSIDSKISTSQILDNSASTSNEKDSLLESSDKNADHLYANEVDTSVGGKAGEYYRHIQPTKTTATQQDKRAEIVKTTSLHGRTFGGHAHSGEAYGAPRGRSLLLSEPETPTPIFAVGRKKTNASQVAEEWMKAGAETPGLPPASFRSSYDERKTNPDIQDIITGIVKLLNGNVKVQANPNLPPGAGRTRINNRGPPRITDVPPLPPDFDTSGPHPAINHRPPLLLPLQTSSRPLPPYPFDRPPAIAALPPQPSEHLSHPDHPFMTGVPVPEQVVPVSNSDDGRPPANQGIVRPHRPRPPRPRPSTKPNVSNNRRPPPIPLSDMEQLLPSYTLGVNKNTQADGHNISVTVTDKGNQDIEEHQYTNPQATLTVQEGEEIVTTTATSKSQPSPVDMPSNTSEDDQVTITTEDTTDEAQNKGEEERDKHTSDIKNPALSSSTEEKKIIATVTSSSSTVNEATQEALPTSHGSTKGEDVGTVGGSSSEVPLLEPSIGVGIATPVLESSMQEILVHDSTASNAWGGTQSAATATTVLPSNQPSLHGETQPEANSATSSSSHALDKLKQTTGEYRTQHLKKPWSYTSTHPYVFMH